MLHLNSGNLITISGLSKSYSSEVLSGVHLELLSGQVHALVGENGAGKSTLAKILAGLLMQDAGEMFLRGQSYAPRTRAQAESLGVRLVMQELNVIGSLSIAENILLDQMPHRFGWIDYRRLNAEARGLMMKVGLGHLDPNRRVHTLGIGQKQLIEIAAGLSRSCQLLILDEPTAALTDQECGLLFTQIARLKTEGVGILYISHRLEEIQTIADRITVLRDGKVVSTTPTGEITIDEIVRRMLGVDLSQKLSRRPTGNQEPALRVKGLYRGDAVRNVNFDVRRGEILGFAGLVGSGRTETMRAVFGADPVEKGEIYLYGSGEPARIRSPHDAVRLGIALLSENRKEEGLLLPLPVGINVTLTRLRDLLRFGFWLRRGSETAVAEHFIKHISVRCSSSQQAVGELSGGNQQKVVIAKWLYRDCDILIFDEPTRGIDVGSKFEIYELLAGLASKGKAILLVSSDLKELMTICDRIAVMSAGQLVATFPRDEWSRDKIIRAALSNYMGDSAGGETWHPVN